MMDFYIIIFMAGEKLSHILFIFGDLLDTQTLDTVGKFQLVL